MNDPQTAQPRELQVGGPVDPAEKVYIERGADKEFLDLLKAGEFVSVVTSRQMGKTSLVYRAMAELGAHGYRFAYYDLSRIKSEADAGRYFRTLVAELARELNAGLDLDAFWAPRANQAVSQSFIDFFRAVLAQLPGPIVVVLDEIDSTLELAFTDDLFTAIRSIYTSRPREALFKRLSFCLVGVATPNELIKARRTTPYNIGRTIWLGDFNAEDDDLSALARVLNSDPSIAAPLLARVLYWTGGQPYLTARLCDELRRTSAREPEAVDALVEETFSNLDQLRSDAHFDQTQRFVSERVSNGAEVLGLYERILRAGREKDQAANLAYAHLKLSGLVKRDESGVLVPRNRIYERLFNLEWVRKSRPKRELRRARAIAYAAAALLVLGVIGGGVYYQTSVAPLQAREAARAELQELQVTLSADARGWTDVRLPAQDTQAVLQRALPHLATISSGRDAQGLSLDLSGLPVIDLKTLAPLTGLRRLVLTGTRVTDLTALASLSGLQDLDVSFNPVTDLAPLARLSNLEQLDVSSTRVNDLAPLSGLSGLQELNISRTAVEDLTPLKGLANLRTLALDGLGISDFNADGRIPHLKVLQDPAPRNTGAAYRPGETFRDCRECPQMVVVPAGSFVMGSPEGEEGRTNDEGRQHKVTITRAFAVGKFEVRFDEWMHCVIDQQCRMVADEGWGRGPRPVINVSWEEAMRYVDWLAKTSGQPYRLLSEAEWEYAARAGTTGVRYWTEGESACAYANVHDAQTKNKYKFQRSNFDCDDGYPEAAPVGTFRPNAFGLYDMMGNVWEWAQDCYHDSYEGAPDDGSAWMTKDCTSRVIRGGGWDDEPQFVRAAIRSGLTSDDRVYDLGFRVARTLP